MCTLLIGLRAHPRYRLVLTANRDEFYDRPTAAAAFWDDAPQIFGGRDLTHRGTWLGITRTGRIAALTNYRDPHKHRADAPSRGQLVSDYLLAQSSAQEYLEQLREKGLPYSGYNLVVGDAGSLLHYSNKSDLITPLESGIHGVSNHLLDTPWPKVVRGKAALARVLEAGDPDPEELFALLADASKAPDAELPDTGVGLEWERLLSSVFIASERYGTRSSSVLLVNNDLQATFIERSFDEGKKVGDIRVEFDWAR